MATSDLATASLLPTFMTPLALFALLCAVFVLLLLFSQSSYHKLEISPLLENVSYQDTLTLSGSSSVAPSKVKHFSNPILYPALFAVYAGHHAVRERWNARNGVIENAKNQQDEVEED
ncbi:hypothetical protein BKA63DRAFT_526100 [Paraphoma chrysanthemicola]|nr:hypothetical protein BKA63DRAFT_526100 [Paraphoma chrysanthemicola]